MYTFVKCVLTECSVVLRIKNSWFGYIFHISYIYSGTLSLHTIRRDAFFILCLISSIGLIFHLHNASEHILDIVSRQGVVQHWNVLETIVIFMTEFRVTWESDCITTLSDLLPDEGHILSPVVHHTARNIWLLSLTPPIVQPWHSWWMCGWKYIVNTT